MGILYRPVLSKIAAIRVFRMGVAFLLSGALAGGALGEEREEQPSQAGNPDVEFSDFDPVPSDRFLDDARGIAQWIILNSDYDSEVPLPAFVKLPRATLNYIFFSQLVGGYQGQDSIQALYVPHIMLLSEDFEVEVSAATLVHELVHHFQFVTGREFDCTAEAEREAYELQAKWVEETGEGDMPSALFMRRLTCKNPHDYWR